MNYINFEPFWSNSTLIIYLLIIFGSLFIMNIARGYGIKNKLFKNNINLGLLLVFIILLFFKGFGTVGTDLLTGYYYNFINGITFETFPDKTVEFGYRFLSVLVRNFTDNYQVFVFIVSLLTLLPIFLILNKYKDKINLPISVLLYITLFYFNSFSAYRIAIASSIGLLYFDAIIEKKYIKSLLFLFLAVSFHKTTIVLSIVLICIFFKMRNNKINAFIIIVSFLFLWGIKDEVSAILNNSERYYIYSSFENISIGMEQFIYFLPIYIFYFFGKKKDDKYINFVFFLLISTAFCCGMLGYIISIFGRFKDVFLCLIIIIPWLYKNCVTKYNKYNVLINILTVVYCVFRFMIYIVQYYESEAIMPYRNVFGWILK